MYDPDETVSWISKSQLLRAVVSETSLHPVQTVQLPNHTGGGGDGGGDGGGAGGGGGGAQLLTRG